MLVGATAATAAAAPQLDVYVGDLLASQIESWSSSGWTATS